MFYWTHVRKAFWRTSAKLHVPQCLFLLCLAVFSSGLGAWEEDYEILRDDDYVCDQDSNILESKKRRGLASLIQAVESKKVILVVNKGTFSLNKFKNSRTRRISYSKNNWIPNGSVVVFANDLEPGICIPIRSADESIYYFNVISDEGVSGYVERQYLSTLPYPEGDEKYYFPRSEIKIYKNKEHSEIKSSANPIQGVYFRYLASKPGVKQVSYFHLLGNEDRFDVWRGESIDAQIEKEVGWIKSEELSAGRIKEVSKKNLSLLRQIKIQKQRGNESDKDAFITTLSKLRDQEKIRQVVKKLKSELPSNFSCNSEVDVELAAGIEAKTPPFFVALKGNVGGNVKWVIKEKNTKLLYENYKIYSSSLGQNLAVVRRAKCKDDDVLDELEFVKFSLPQLGTETPLVFGMKENGEKLKDHIAKTYFGKISDPKMYQISGHESWLTVYQYVENSLVNKSPAQWSDITTASNTDGTSQEYALRQALRAFIIQRIAHFKN